MFRETNPVIAHFLPAVRATVVMAFVWAGGLLAGCAMLETASPTASQPTALSWLTNWVSQPMEMAPGFDVELIRPEPRPTTVVPDNLLEITVWDLYEPGKPYSFPVRVSNRLTVEAPFLGEVPVEGRTIQDIEVDLADRFRKGEFLLNPRILVRSLDSPLVKVQVTGAVSRGGFVELARTDPSVYAAIVSAGGLRKTAGTQVAVTRRALAVAGSGTAQSTTRTDQPADALSNDMAGTSAPEQPHAPAQRANSVDEIAVSPVAPAIRPAAAGQNSGQGFFFVGEPHDGSLSATGPPPGDPQSGPPAASTREAKPNAHSPASPAGDPDQSTVWYDVTLARDREHLKHLQLADGDSVTVKAATPPLRIGGIVNRPGAYPLPPGRTLNVWQAIELAGGIHGENVPLNITLMRPAGEGRSAQRWFLNVPAYDRHPVASPVVEHGDVLHVEPTTGSKIKRAVGDLWNKP